LKKWLSGKRCTLPVNHDYMGSNPTEKKCFYCLISVVMSELSLFTTVAAIVRWRKVECCSFSQDVAIVAIH